MPGKPKQRRGQARPAATAKSFCRVSVWGRRCTRTGLEIAAGTRSIAKRKIKTEVDGRCPQLRLAHLAEDGRNKCMVERLTVWRNGVRSVRCITFGPFVEPTSATGLSSGILKPHAELIRAPRPSGPYRSVADAARVHSERARCAGFICPRYFRERGSVLHR